jgi:hypothetical protein
MDNWWERSSVYTNNVQPATANRSSRYGCQQRALFNRQASTDRTYIGIDMVSFQVAGEPSALDARSAGQGRTACEHVAQPRPFVRTWSGLFTSTQLQRISRECMKILFCTDEAFRRSLPSRRRCCVDSVSKLLALSKAIIGLVGLTRAQDDNIYAYTYIHIFQCVHVPPGVDVLSQSANGPIEPNRCPDSAHPLPMQA